MILPAQILDDIVGLLPDPIQYPLFQSGVFALPAPWSWLQDPRLQKTCSAAIALQWEIYSPRFFGPTGASDFTGYPCNDGLSFGFIALNPSLLKDIEGLKSRAEIPISGDFVFGVLSLVPRGRIEGEQRFLRTIPLANMSFPVIEVTGTIARQGAPPAPNHAPNAGSSACWAKSRTGSSWNLAILTAEHVVRGLSLGSIVSLAHSTAHSLPHSAVLAEVTDCPVDVAALAVNQKDWPPRAAPITVLNPAVRAIAPGMPAQLIGRHTTKSGSVLRVNQNPGYAGPMVAERVITDIPGIPGDSGGLVADGLGNTAFGIYMGTIPSVTGAARDGIAQGMWQVSRSLGADIWY